MFCAGEELIEAAKRNDFCKVLTSQSSALPLEPLTLGGIGPLSSVISWSSMVLPLSRCLPSRGYFIQLAYPLSLVLGSGSVLKELWALWLGWLCIWGEFLIHRMTRLVPLMTLQNILRSQVW